MHRKKDNFFLIILCFLSGQLFSQLYSFDNYSVTDGLIQSNVVAIVQDKKGNIWLGTEGGLSRFDGKTFYNYTTEDGLADNNISAMLLTSNGELWLGHSSGNITRYIDNKFEKLSLDTIRDKKIYSIYEDKAGKIWVSVAMFGVVQINKTNDALTAEENLKFYRSGDGLSSYVFSMFESKNGNICFLTDVGVKYLSPGSDKFEFLRINGQSLAYVSAIKEDEKGNLWYGSTLGQPTLVKYDPSKRSTKSFPVPVWIRDIVFDKNGNTWAATWGDGLVKLSAEGKLTNYHASNGLPALKIYALSIDREGNILVGTQGSGLFIFKGERFITYNVSQGLINDKVWAVEEVENGNIFIATGSGVSVLDPVNGTFNNHEKITGNTKVAFRAAVRDSKGDVWLGTYQDKLLKYNPKTNEFNSVSVVNDFISNPFIGALCVDAKDNIWIATGNALVVFDPASTSVRDFVGIKNFDAKEINALYCDSENNIWISVVGRGLYKYNGKEFKLYAKEEGLTNTSPTALTEDKAGNLWVGTSGGGVFVYNGTAFKHYTTQDGLVSDYINLLVKDNKGDIWIGTNKGLNRFVQNSKSFISYGKFEGFTAIETKPNAVHVDKKGNIWFGTVNGLIKYNSTYDQLNTLEALTNITDIKYNYSRSIPLQNNYSLSHDQNTLMLSYSGICISNPDAVKFMVMLEGEEENWRPATNQTSVIYSNLSPGNYTFKVKASNNLGVWNKEPVSFSFRIRPPWYFTWWAYLAYVVVGVLLFFTYVKWRERKLVVEKRVLEEKVRERTAEVVEKNKQLDEKNKDIMASIRYAKRIQDAILPPDEFVEKYLPKTFILFKPKDIVSGDFYWLHDKGDKVLFAAVDCTGHGVPGAFMSIIGHNHLEQIVGEQGITQPALVLDALNKSVSDTLRQSHAEDQVKDGMDIALCMFDRKTNELQYSGAFNPLYWIRNGVLNEIKASKFPIGNLKSGDQHKFTNHSIQLEKGDTIYIFSDGYADQFGGVNGKKLKYSALKKMLLDTQHLNMKEQGEYMTKAIDQWKEGFEQVDDILLIGTRL